MSRVWHRELCGGFREAAERRLVLEDVSPVAFRKVMGLACCAGGSGATTTTGLGEVVELALLADRYEVVAVRDVLEAAAIRSLNIHSCPPLLDTRSSGASLSALSAAVRSFALRNFEELAGTDEFLALGEEALGSLLEADELNASAEERVFEALIAWMTHPAPRPPATAVSPPLDAPAACDAPIRASQPPAALRGESLLGAVRFPLMDGAYLARVARGRVAAESLDGLVLEACAVKHVPQEERPSLALRYLRPSSLAPRTGPPPQPEVRARGHRHRRPVPRRTANEVPAPAAAP